MNIFITGGSGFIGSSLIDALLKRGHCLTILTRFPKKCDRLINVSGVSLLEGDPSKKGDWQNYVSGNQCLINLAGESIFSRWTEKRKQLIWESRVFTTRNLVEALEEERGKDISLFSASGAGYYGFSGNQDFHEKMGPGSDFLADLAKEWENEAAKASKKGIRVISMRLGMVLGKNGGGLARMLPFFRCGIGGRIGDGNQWISWIHIKDLVNALLFLINKPSLSGPVNFTSPNPLRNRDLVKSLAAALHRPAFLPIPGLMIKLVGGDLAEALLNGQRVFPEKLLENGFTFSFPEIDGALGNLLENKKTILYKTDDSVKKHHKGEGF